MTNKHADKSYGAKETKADQNRRLKEEKPIPERASDDPFTEEDFEAVLRKVTRKVSDSSQSDSAKK